MNDSEQIVKRLSFENIIWIVFIIVSVIDIYGDELLKKSITDNNKELSSKAENLFIFVSLISILVYIYFLVRNYYDYKENESTIYEVRLIGSILVLSGTLLLFYFLLFNNKDYELTSNI